MGSKLYFKYWSQVNKIHFPIVNTSNLRVITLMPELHYIYNLHGLPTFSSQASPEVYEIENIKGLMLKYCFSIWIAPDWLVVKYQGMLKFCLFFFKIKRYLLWSFIQIYIKNETKDVILKIPSVLIGTNMAARFEDPYRPANNGTQGSYNR